MEEADEDLVVDIDSVDKKNPLAVVEYVDDLYAYYKKAEVWQLFQESVLLVSRIIVTYVTSDIQYVENQFFNYSPSTWLAKLQFYEDYFAGVLLNINFKCWILEFFSM